TFRSDPASHCDSQLAVIPEGESYLDGVLTEGRFADDCGPTSLLQNTRQYLGGRSRPGIHDHRQGWGRGGQTSFLDRILQALARCLATQHQPLGQELAGHKRGDVYEPARVVAKVEDDPVQALRLPLLEDTVQEEGDVGAEVR